MSRMTRIAESLRTTTYGELERLVNRVANGLCDRNLAPGQAIALYMPLNLECVVAYLAIIRAGSRVVSIADSFPPAEIRRRMAIVGANCAVTMDRHVHAGKVLPTSVVEATTHRRASGAGRAATTVKRRRAGGDGRSTAAPKLRPGDICLARPPVRTKTPSSP